MSLGKRLLLFSPSDPYSTALAGQIADWGCLVTTCQSVDELRGRWDTRPDLSGRGTQTLLAHPRA